jgi:transposase
VICAATFLAAIGDLRRFRGSRQLVAYHGLDPRVRQSGTEPARSGRISKRGSSSARWALVEAAASVVRQPGLLRALMSACAPAAATEGPSSRSRPSSWRCSGACSPAARTTHQEPSLTGKKLRRLEIVAGAPTLTGKRTGVWATRERMRQAERELAHQAQASHERTVRDWNAASRKKKVGASVTAERA